MRRVEVIKKIELSDSNKRILKEAKRMIPLYNSIEKGGLKKSNIDSFQKLHAEEATESFQFAEDELDIGNGMSKEQAIIPKTIRVYRQKHIAAAITYESLAKAHRNEANQKTK